MTSERWLQVKALFEASLAQPPEARLAFLETTCNEVSLRQEVASLLEAAGEAGPVDRLEDAWARPLAAARDAAVVPAAKPTVEPTVGQRVGPYQVAQVIGRGGMGTVYRAERADGQFEQHVALKLVREGLDSQSLRDRFLAERRVLARLQHPGIARLLDGGLTEDGQPYFAMELVEGERLDDYCDAGRLGIAQRLWLFGQICEAVHHAHQHLVVHRDLKPSNILVTENGEPHVKLLDFGIAKLLEEAESEAPTQTTERVLTPEYAAPEQIRGTPVSTVTDVYSLGVVLYELLTGHRPYEVRMLSPGEMERVICDTEPPRPSTIVATSTEAGGSGKAASVTPVTVSRARSTVPATLVRRLAGDLDTIVLKALAKEPERRYTSAEALLEDIKRHLDGLPVKARPPSVRYRAQKFVQRNTLSVSLVALVILALGVGLAGTAWQAHVAATERDIARREAATAEQVTDFLVEVFGASDPWKDPKGSGGADVTARALLERGVERVEELDGQPAVQAEMLDALGNVYLNLGQFEEARSLLERALAERRALWGAEHEAVAESMTSLAWLLYQAGTYEEAEALQREALTVLRRLVGEDHPDVAQSLNNLGVMLHARGAYKEAEALQREAIALRRQFLIEVHPDLTQSDVAQSLNNLAVVLYARGAYEEAEELHREVLAINRKLLGEAHPEVATDLINLAVVLHQRDEFEEAEARYREALVVAREALGNEHPMVGNALNSLGMLLTQIGAHSEAGDLLREALELRRQLLGEAHPAVATTLNNLALALRETGAYSEAEGFHREALAMFVQLLGEAHPHVAVTQSNLAVVLRRRGSYKEAEVLQREALAMFAQLLGEDHPHVAIFLHRLGQLLLDMGQADEAEPLLQQVVATQREALGEQHANTAEAHVALGRALTVLGRYEEAELHLEEALMFYQSEKAGVRAQDGEVAREALMVLHKAWGKPENETR